MPGGAAPRPCDPCSSEHAVFCPVNAMNHAHEHPHHHHGQVAGRLLWLATGLTLGYAGHATLQPEPETRIVRWLAAPTYFHPQDIRR